MTIDTAKERTELEWLKSFAFFSCRTPACAEETSYPPHMLRVTASGEMVCEDCWVAVISDGGRDWVDLPKFDPFSGYAAALDAIDTQAAEIERLRKDHKIVALRLNDFIHQRAARIENEYLAEIKDISDRARAALSEGEP